MIASPAHAMRRPPERGTAFIRGRCAELGLTLGELAEKSGVHITHLSRIARGTKEPGLAVAIRIAEALGWTLDELARGAKSRRRWPRDIDPELHPLAALIARKGQDRKTFAAAHGFSTTHLSAVIHGGRGLTLAMAARLADALEVPLDAFARHLPHG